MNAARHPPPVPEMPGASSKPDHPDTPAAPHTARAAHWSRLAERGSGFGMRVVFMSYRLLGRRFTRVLLYPIVLYFFLTSRRARTASRRYLQRLRATHHPDLACGTRMIFRHMYAFAGHALDKVAAWAGEFDARNVDFPETLAFDELCASGRGALFIGAHLGNLEMTRALARHRRLVAVNAVVYSENAQKFQRILAHAHADFGANLIEVSSLGPDTAILLKDKVDRGEIIVIVGDRTPPAENGRTFNASFLGHDAPFAMGPWILANLLECPVYLLFCLPIEDSGRIARYRIHLEKFSDRVVLPRATRAQTLQEFIQRYALRLEHYCALAPLQWFNFHDFWQDESQPPGPAS